MKQTYETGVQGERRAEEWLCQAGMICLERRYRAKGGEIDLIMREGETIVFVEVKTRNSGAPGEGLLAVNAAKQRRIANGATTYLLSHHLLNREIRFDIVEVTPEGILHVPNAFQPGGVFYR